MPGSRRRKRKIRDRSPIKIKLLKTSPRRAKFVKQEPKSEDEFEEEADAEEVEEQAQTSKRKGYRQNYSLKDLLNAYNMVKYENMPVQTAAKTFGVPSTTLRDRVRGNVVLESVRPGPSSLLSIEQEMTLVDHISFMASIGCGYTRNDIFNLATDLAVHLGLIKEGRQLQRSWYRRFRSRWPVINAVRPNRSARKRSPAAVALEQESIKKYFEELHDVLEEHDLMEKPHRIFTLDESFIPQTRDKTDPECCVKAIGCGNAIGSALPPYFVFPQSSDSDSEKTEEKIVSSANPGALIRFRETYDDWSESEIFQDYIRSHFLQSAEVGEASPEDPVLILYDRAKHHVSSCIEWAKGLNIVLYLLPPFYGYATCSEQIGCLGQMKRCAMQECEKFLFFNSGKKVSKGSLCNFVSNAYEKVMSAESLIALFRKTGTYPYNPDGIAKDRLPAYIIMPNKNKVEKTSDTLTAAFIRQTKNQARKVAKKSKSSRTEPYKSKSKRRKKVRKRESSDSGSDLDDFEQEFESKMAADSDGEPLSPVQPPSIPILTKTEVVAEAQPESSTEETQTEIVMEEIAPEPLDGEEEESEGEYTCITDGQLFTLKCAICKKYNPPKTFLVEGEAMISWTQCDSCQAWAHLCCSTVSIPVPDCPFLCPPCTIEFKLFGNSYTPSNITEWINAKRAITENILSAQNN